MQWLKLLLIAALLVAGGGLWMAANRDRAGEIHRIPVAGSGQLFPAAMNAASEPRALDSPDRYLPPTRIVGRSGRRELVLLDRALADLAKDLARDGRQVLLVGGPGGLSDAAAQLPAGRRFAAIHIVSHGRPGLFSLDGATIDAAALTASGGAGLDDLRGHLLPGGDILVYGCEAAQGPQGRDLLRAIAARTGANVAGSDALTGIGKWSLGQHVGRVGTAPLQLPRPTRLWTNELYEGGWFGDSNVPAGAVAPHPKAGQTGSGRLATIGDNTGGQGVTFSVQSLGCCTAQTLASASTTSYAAAVTANDYFYSNLVVGGTNGAAISKFQYNQVINNAAGAQFQLALYDTVTAALTPLTGAITVSGSTLSLQVATTPVSMVAGRTYQLRFYGFNCGGSAICYIDNPQIWTKANQPPSAANDGFTTAYATAVSGNLTSNDSDPDGHALTVSKINGSNYTVGVPIALAGGSLTMTSAAGDFTFTPASGFYGSQSFTYTASDGFGGTASATATVTVNQADLALSLGAANAYVWQGGSQSYTLTVSSSASSNVTASGIAVRALLPAGFSFASAVGTGSYNASTGVWTVGSLAPGGSASLTINGTVTAAPRSVVASSAEITASSMADPDSTPNNGATGEDDYAAASFTVIDPSLSVSKTSQVISDGVNTAHFKAVPGANVRYCVLITNTGNTTATGVVATDSLPANVSYVSGSARTGTTCATASFTSGIGVAGSSITASSSPLAPGQTFAAIYEVTIG